MHVEVGQRIDMLEHQNCGTTTVKLLRDFLYPVQKLGFPSCIGLLVCERLAPGSGASERLASSD